MDLGRCNKLFLAPASAIFGTSQSLPTVEERKTGLCKQETKKKKSRFTAIHVALRRRYVHLHQMVHLIT